MDYEKISERIDKYVNQVAEAIQCPFEFQLVIEKEDGSNKMEADCYAAFHLYSVAWPEMFVSRRVIECVEEGTTESLFEAEKSIVHEFVHGIMLQSLEITKSLVSNKALDVSIERDTDAMASRMVNLLRQCNVGL